LRIILYARKYSSEVIKMAEMRCTRRGTTYFDVNRYSKKFVGRMYAGKLK